MHNDELYFIYRGTIEGQLNMLVYDQNKKRWRAASYPVRISAVYSEEAGPASSLLLGDSTGSMYSTQSGTGDVLQASTPDITVTIRTGAYDQGMPLNLKEYGNVLFDLDPGGATVAKPVTITPLLNGEMITGAAITVTRNRPPAGSSVTLRRVRIQHRVPDHVLEELRDQSSLVSVRHSLEE